MACFNIKRNSLPVVVMVVVLLVIPSCVVGYKFLLPATSLMSTKSHYMGLTALTQELVARGHEVTLLLLDRRGTGGMLPNSYTDNITYPNSKTDEELAAIRAEMATAMATVSSISLTELISKVGEMYDIMYFGCYELFKHNDTLQRLKQKRFDMIFTTPVVDVCDAMLAEYLDVPFAVMTGARRMPAFHEDLYGIPVPSAYVPFSFIIPLTDDMSFTERVLNVLMRFLAQPLLDYMLVTRPAGWLQEMYDIRRDLTPKQIVGRAQLWLCHTTFALDYARPTAPNWIPIAGYMFQPPKPLPQDLEDFVQGSGEHGFVIFSLGSMTVSLANEELTNSIAKVFSELKQRVVWRYVGPTPRNLGNNTRILKWLPQTDLIAHPKARLLIYHGGSAGVHEAAYYGVPMVLMPLAADQPTNAKVVESKGMGVVVNINTLDEEEFRRAVTTVLQEPSFREKAKRASAIFQDNLAPPLDRAIFWIEHVIKYGSDHLRSRATEMGFIELNSLDVLAFLTVILLTSSYLLYAMIVKCCCRPCCKKQRKTKTD